MKIERKKSERLIFRIILLMVLPLVFVQCEGPMGPRGYDGEDGVDGINNVHAVIYDVATNAWEGDVDGYFTYLSVPEITEDIFYNGAVLVYRLFETEPMSFNKLPYTYVDNDLVIYMDYDAYIGEIDLIYKEVYQGVNDTPAPDQAMAFKVIIIEGMPLAKIKDMVDINDLSAVCAKFNVDSGSTVQ